MYYFKTLNDDGTLNALHSSSNDGAVRDSSLIPISQEEFEEILAEMDKKAEEEARIAEEEILAEQKRIENLEKENASLLFQLLTGEEYTDV